MRFACIEYTTKTGTIWRPAPTRPNYLCDPEREIDPTSFGCYTSALDGEHIPLTGLIYQSLEHPPSNLQRMRQDVARRFHGSFHSYDLTYLRKFDVLLVVYQISNGDELMRFTQRARTELPDTVIVSCSSPPLGRLKEYWKNQPETVETYRAFIRASHFNMNVCRTTVPFYRLLTNNPSLYLPQPYPVEYALQQGVGSRMSGVEGNKLTAGAQADPPIIYVAGDTVRPDIMSGHLVAKVLQQRHPELLIRVTKTPEFSLNTSFLRGARYEVVPFRPWAEQLRALAAVRLVINTDLWWTRGRVPVDCAAAGVPCVGTTSDGQAELWPDLTAEESINMERLVALAERALTDGTFRRAVVQKAQRRLQSYTYVKTVERFKETIELTRSNRLDEWRDPVWAADDVLMRP